MVFIPDPMHVYRVSRRKHANALDGAGSRINGGRWNNPGTACIYTSQSRALAILEYAVNVRLDDIPPDLVMITLEVPDNENNIFIPRQLPQKWNSQITTQASRDFGTALLKKAEHLIIKIPSVVIPEEYNYIINPRHPNMKKVLIADLSPFSFDARLKN